MFIQALIMAIGITGIIIGVKEGDYLSAICGLLVVAHSFHLIYQLKTGKSFFESK